MFCSLNLILVPNTKKLTNKIQYSERYTNETRKNIHTETEVFRGEATAPLHYETEEERSKVIRKTNIVYPIIIQNHHQIIGTPKAMQKLTGILWKCYLKDLRKQ